jgi:type IV secretion system protein VirB11
LSVDGDGEVVRQIAGEAKWRNRVTRSAVEMLMLDDFAIQHFAEVVTFRSHFRLSNAPAVNLLRRLCNSLLMIQNISRCSTGVAMSEELRRYRLFVALTRRQVFAGVTNAFSVMNAIVSVVRVPIFRAWWKLIAVLRMRLDRIILGELHGVEAFTFLRAVNTGHPGSMTTIHADTPQRAIEQLALLVLQAGSKLSRDDVRHYVRESVDVFVQLERRGGRRRVSRVLAAE